MMVSTSFFDFVSSLACMLASAATILALACLVGLKGMRSVV